MSKLSPPATGTVYRDDDLVYVDPEERCVVGGVEWSRNGNPRPKPIPPRVDKEPVERRRGPSRAFYPWGTYRSMKNVYRLEGKQLKRADPGRTLDDVLEKAVREAYWD